MLEIRIGTPTEPSGFDSSWDFGGLLAPLLGTDAGDQERVGVHRLDLAAKVLLRGRRFAHLGSSPQSDAPAVSRARA